MNAIVARETVEQICAHREKAIALYQATQDSLKEACKVHALACQIGGRTTTPHLAVDSRDSGYRQDEFMERMIKNIDRDMWRGLINGTPIGSLMDRQERKKFEEDVERDPPPATADNVRATLERLIGESDAIFRRGLVNAFKQLDRDYASNDGFKIGERIVITWGCSWDKACNWFRLHRGEYLQDVDRVMHVLDGKKAPEYSQGIQAAIESDMQGWGSNGRRGKGEVTTPYWRAKYFKNGNLHLFPLRRDLLDQCNRIIAEHFGLVVPAHRDVRDPTPNYKFREGEAVKEDFFATPSQVALDLVTEAEIELGMAVLEPSAGTGAIAEAVRLFTHDITCVELNPERAATLRAKGFEVQEEDFLDIVPVARFDRIIMNPPFSRQQDLRHVLHALKFLKPGGRLVAIMSSSAERPAHKLGEHFTREVERLGGDFWRLPAGSFRESGTSVNTTVLRIELAEADEERLAA